MTKEIAVTRFREDEDDEAFVVARFDTIAEAEDYIAGLLKRDRDGVLRGDYGIDAPEPVKPRR